MASICCHVIVLDEDDPIESPVIEPDPPTTTVPFIPASLWPATVQYISYVPAAGLDTFTFNDEPGWI